MEMTAATAAKGDEDAPGVDLEKGIEIDFGKVLAKAKADDAKWKSKRCASCPRRKSKPSGCVLRCSNNAAAFDYIDRYVQGHVRRQPEVRLVAPHGLVPPRRNTSSASSVRPTVKYSGKCAITLRNMRQALMMLNGLLTHEASRVGEFEADVRSDRRAEESRRSREAGLPEILTREPSADEIKEAKSIIAAHKDPLDGMADFRWILLNCNEFRFLP